MYLIISSAGLPFRSRLRWRGASAWSSLSSSSCTSRACRTTWTVRVRPPPPYECTALFAWCRVVLYSISSLVGGETYSLLTGDWGCGFAEQSPSWLGLSVWLARFSRRTAGRSVPGCAGVQDREEEGWHLHPDGKVPWQTVCVCV